MKKELIFQIKSNRQNIRQIGAIYCNNMGSNCKISNKMANISPLINSLYESPNFEIFISSCKKTNEGMFTK